MIGSPPRLWGKRDDVGVGRDRRRFTPTPVGKTSNASGRAISTRFTPTPVGKTAGTGVDQSRNHSSGSPPRLWGKRSRKFGNFTPPLSAVHPHACGENGLRRSENCSVEPRFTPTPVGKTAYAGITESLRLFRGSPPRLWGKRCSKRFDGQG